MNKQQLLFLIIFLKLFIQFYSPLFFMENESTYT